MTTHRKSFLWSIPRLYINDVLFVLASLLAMGLLPLQDALAHDPVQLSNLANPSTRDALPLTITKTRAVAVYRSKRADFKQEDPSYAARHTADWVMDSEDNRGLPFVIIDKANAKVFVFDTTGSLQGSARALLGLARGDDAIPGIGERELSTIRPEERTTPAGRFVASLGRNLHGDEILWVDYHNAISMHRVVTTNKKEHRLQRLATLTTNDKRISYGCINVPVKFFNTVVRPAFINSNGIVYVLPETRSAHEVFGSYDVDEHPQRPKPHKPLRAP